MSNKRLATAITHAILALPIVIVAVLITNNVTEGLIATAIAVIVSLAITGIVWRNRHGEQQ